MLRAESASDKIIYHCGRKHDKFKGMFTVVEMQLTEIMVRLDKSTSECPGLGHVGDDSSL